ncbi:glycosyltransferase family 2 protein, partial [Chroococcidiopsidales cyanobacterium LEGE 13417]|nr:glycosyltransferase family 2 protein [Chroococcidiopsidales cyanobacterium LEGE 13417]
LWLMSELAQPQTFGLLWEKVEQRQQTEGFWRQRWQLVPIQEAISALRIRLEKLRHQRRKVKVESQKSKVKKVSFSTDTACSYYHKIS